MEQGSAEFRFLKLCGFSLVRCRLRQIRVRSSLGIMIRSTGRGLYPWHGHPGRGDLHGLEARATSRSRFPRNPSADGPFPILRPLHQAGLHGFPMNIHHLFIVFLSVSRRTCPRTHQRTACRFQGAREERPCVTAKGAAYTQRPTPNTQRPTPNTQHPTPNTQHPTPNTLCYPSYKNFKFYFARLRA